jgi:hypothetical protein
MNEKKDIRKNISFLTKLDMSFSSEDLHLFSVPGSKLKKKKVPLTIP